jgi:Cu+-exporting ATPase
MHQNLVLPLSGASHRDRAPAPVELELRRLPGVLQVFVDWSSRTACLHYDSSRIAAETIARKIRDLGYETRVPRPHEAAASASSIEGQPRVFDVVCGATVFLHDTTRLHRAVFDGNAFFFCSSHCHDRFLAEPARYLRGNLAGTMTRPPASVKAALPVIGLSCGGGALQLEKALARLPGVRTVYVNPATEMVYAELVPEAMSVETLARAIREHGYAS